MDIEKNMTIFLSGEGLFAFKIVALSPLTLIGKYATNSAMSEAQIDHNTTNMGYPMRIRLFSINDL